MSVIDQIKEMISPAPAAGADAWAEGFFPGPQQAVASRVVRIVLAIAGGEIFRLTDQTRLIEDLALNELQRVQLVMAVEEQFGIEISEQDAQGIQMIGQLVERVHGKLLQAEEVKVIGGK